MSVRSTLETPIEFLKGVGPTRGELLRSELKVKVYNDLLWELPFRYIDKSVITPINAVNKFSDNVQIKGTLERVVSKGEGRKTRLTAVLRDGSGFIDLVWFKGVQWIKDALKPGQVYIVYGRVNAFGNSLSIPHPEMELEGKANISPSLDPVYHSTDKLTKKGIEGKVRRNMVRNLIEKIQPGDVPEILPQHILTALRLPSRFDSLRAIHFPKDNTQLSWAIARIKFEEFFLMQIRLLRMKVKRTEQFQGYKFDKVGDAFNTFFQNHLPFTLTGAQKRVIKEIRRDLGMGVQMNRLLQGDVGSGKTMVGLLSMLLAIDNGYQALLMAPTQILAQQHYEGISEYLKDMDIKVAFLTGSIKGKQRKAILEATLVGDIQILIGTHALLEDPVQFHKLGLAITDEQHRFGVKQRARLWNKSKPNPPHILVMTATPIPRTLAMTMYGDLDVSIIDELPPGRKEIQTVHKTEHGRLWTLGLIKKEIAKGRQVYIVYPLIEESATLDLLNLEQGYETLLREFPRPDHQISVVHGRMKAEAKDQEMARFVNKETQIMVATTVIEVGVNVPNATLMVIENAERFGLAQLHQLRGRVGRGGDQSFCVLMTSFKLSKEAKFRLETMVSTNDGFVIAEADLKLRGPGNIEGLQQSGIVDLRLGDIARDNKILVEARKRAMELLENDPHLQLPINHNLALYMTKVDKEFKEWSRVS